MTFALNQATDCQDHSFTGEGKTTSQVLDRARIHVVKERKIHSLRTGKYTFVAYTKSVQDLGLIGAQCNQPSSGRDYRGEQPLVKRAARSGLE
jgi:hypothetical protein